MDTMPPQAPPALIQPAHEVAASIYRRIAATSAWVDGLQAALPVVPEQADNGSRQAFFTALDSFWTPGRRADVASQLAGLMDDAARLMAEDQTLSAEAANVARGAAGMVVGTPPEGMQVYELRVAGVPYAGALAVTSPGYAGALLFTTSGWQPFPSLDALRATFEAKARARMADTDQLPGLSRQHMTSPAMDTWVTTAPLEGQVFDTLVARMATLQHEKAEQAWVEWALLPEGSTRDIALADALADAVDLRNVINPEGILAERHARLVHAYNEQRLAQVPARVADGWRDAEDMYASVVSVAMHTDVPPASLADYASEAINRRLRQWGVSEDAGNLTIEMTRVAGAGDVLQGLFGTAAVARVSLIQLAYQNMGAFELVQLRATDAQGAPVAALGDSAIRSLVRELDIGPRYSAYLEAYYGSGPEAEGRRLSMTSLMHARMRFQAAEARLGYYLPSASRSFLDDHSERGFRWVQAVLDHPAPEGRRKVEGHDVVVRQITYQGTPLRDVLEIGVRSGDAVPSVVLYTPDAPDGKVFREFADRAEAARQFFYQPAFREYLLDRLPTDYARLKPNGTAREFAGDHLAHWVLGASRDAAYTLTAAPFETAEVPNDFTIAMADVAVQQALRDVATFTRSASEANWQWFTQATLPRFQSQLTDLVKAALYAPAHAAQAAWRLYDSVKAGDRDQAVVDFAEFYVASLGIVNPGVIGASVGRATVAARFRHAGSLTAGAPVARSLASFESRFEAGHLPASGPADAGGIFTIGGGRYISHGGKRYAVRYDTDYATWRLRRPGAPDTAWGPAIQRVGQDAWTYRNTGLAGGSGRGTRRLRDPGKDIFDDYVAYLEREFPDPFEREIVMTRARAELSGRGARAELTASQRLRWERASRQAHEAAIRRDLLNQRRSQATPLNLVVRDAEVPWLLR